MNDQIDVVERILYLHAQREGTDSAMGIDSGNMELMLDAAAEIQRLRVEASAPWHDKDTAGIVDELQIAAVKELGAGWEDGTLDLIDCLYGRAGDKVMRLRAAVESIRNAANVVIEAFKADAAQARAELFKERGAHAETTKAFRDLLAGEPIIRVQQEPDGKWECEVRYLRSSYFANGLSEKDARARADMDATRIRKVNGRPTL